MNNCTSERLKFAAISSEASALLASRPNTGVPPASSRANRAGNMPSRAAANGICADNNTQPFKAPRQEIAATMAIPVPAHGPHNMRAASTMGADESFNADAGTRPITAVTASTVTTPASRVPMMVARGMVRSGWSMFPAGTVATSTPHRAHSASATEALTALGRDSPLGLNGTKRPGSMNHTATSANSSSGTNFNTVSSSCARPASRTPSRFTPAHSHSPPNASAAARSGVAVAAGNSAPTLPAKATARAALPHQIEIQ